MKEKSKIENIFKVAVVIAVVMAFIMPGAAVFINDENRQLLDDILVIDDKIVEIGETYEIFINGTWSEELWGYSFGIHYNYTKIEILSMSYEGTIADTEPEPMFAFAEFGYPGDIYFGVVYGFAPKPDAGTDPMAKIIIKINESAPNGDTILDLDTVTQPNGMNTTCKFTFIDGGDTYPELFDGTLTITDGTDYYELTVNTVGSGIVDLDPAGGTYEDGTEVTLTADPDEGWEFIEWTGDLTGSTNPETITMDSDKEVTAIFEEINNPPEAPVITGPEEGKAGDEYGYTFTTEDPDGDDIYLFIEWGDDTNSEWVGPYESGEDVVFVHTWAEEGTYTIRAKAKDEHGLEGPWGSLDVSMPKQMSVVQQLIYTFMQQLIQRFPRLEQFLPVS